MVEGCKPRWPEPDEIERARQAIVDLVAAYDEALAPAGPDFAGQIFGLLAVAYPPPKLTHAEADLQMAVYVDMLAGLPRDILAAAARRALATSKFFPTIAELIQTGGDDSAVAALEHRVRMRNGDARLISAPLRAQPSISAPTTSRPRNGDLDVLVTQATRYARRDDPEMPPYA